MTARIIDGRAAARVLCARVGLAAERFARSTGRAAGLAVVLVGEDPASAIYVRNKGRQTQECGMASFGHTLPADAAPAALLDLIARLNADPAVDGILVQLPLPPQMDEAEVIAAIDPDKDIDGFTVTSAGRLATGIEGFVPCTPLGCLLLLRGELGDLAGREAVVIGRSNIVGKPMAALLLREGCTVTVAHSRTRDLPAVVRRADIVVAAVGRASLVRADWLKPGATVIDVGINRQPPTPGTDGTGTGTNTGTGPRIVGDVDFAGALAVAGAITPVPGGVGPMTIAVLLRNTIVAAHRNAQLPLVDDLL